MGEYRQELMSLMKREDLGNKREAARFHLLVLKYAKLLDIS